jgi:hypothetical protein
VSEVPDIDWVALGLLVGSVLLAALYALAASGHFPAQLRQATRQRGRGALVLWATMAATPLAVVAVAVRGWNILPWPVAVIGAGGALLLAPLLLQSLSDNFVNGRSGLLVFSLGALILAALLWLTSATG